MPLPALLTALDEATGGRVIRADDAWVVDGRDAPADLRRSGGAIKVTDKQAGLYVELTVR
jgi:hypothetical protein